jgi:hypothetical protein
MTWDEFYEQYTEWDKETAINKLKTVCPDGDGYEIVEVADELFSDNQKEATALINRALTAGVMFDAYDIANIYWLCDQKTTDMATLCSISELDEESIEEIVGCASDNVVLSVVKQRRWKVPEGIYDPYEELVQMEQIGKSLAMESAVLAADYALECLYEAKQAVVQGSDVSLFNTFKPSFWSGLWKHSTLSRAEAELAAAREALQVLNAELTELKRNKVIMVDNPRLASVIDLWFDDKFYDFLTHVQISRVHSQLCKVIPQVEAVQRELTNLMN